MSNNDRTPRRTGRFASFNPGISSDAADTPHLTSNIISSPMPYQSSPMPAGAAPSSPLAGDSQSTNMTNSQSMGGNRTPRASQQRTIRDSSPVDFPTSPSPGLTARQHTVLSSDTSGMFVSQNSEFDQRRARQVQPPSFSQKPRPIPGGTPGLGPSTPGVEATPAPEGEGDAIWGTTINLETARSKASQFLNEFTPRMRMIKQGMSDEDIAEHTDAYEPMYLEEMKLMLEMGISTLQVNISDIKAFPGFESIAQQVINYPQEMVPIFDQCIRDIMVSLAAAEDQRRAKERLVRQMSMQTSDVPDRRQQSMEEMAQLVQYQVRFYGMDTITNMRSLNPSDIDKMITIKGLVIRATPVIPDMKAALFKCGVCNWSVSVFIERDRISEPTVCGNNDCGMKNSMQIQHNRCQFDDKQILKLQETPDDVPAGQTPHSVSVMVHRDMVDMCKAGDRVVVTGIYRASQMRVNPRQRTIKSVHKTYVDAVHTQKVDKKRMGIDQSTLVVGDDVEPTEANPNAAETRRITEDDKRRILETAQRPDIYDLLARSLAPSIYEMDDVKKGILLQLFGGTNKSFKKGGSPKYRGDINILLCGDPSTSKSQMLGYVHKIAPRGVYTSGKGSSAVGLTAYVTRDPETRQLVLESGALVLSDGGVCCIDEFDKMNESTRSVLHEVMEQQTVSVAKAGIITTLNARTSILASANPIGSRYNPDLPVPQNIDLPPTLLSRFDLVYLILDRPDDKTDRRLAKHILSLYLEDTPDHAPTSEEILPVEFLTLYISYARNQIHPKITDGAAEELTNAYVEMRKLGQDVRAAEKRITATTRQLESMIRLSEAHAKMRLSQEVTRDDVLEAYRLIRSALKTAATDAQGRIDMSLLTEGTSAADRRMKEEMKMRILSLIDELTASGNTVRWTEVWRKLGEAVSVQVDTTDFAECMRALEMEGSILVMGEGARRSIRRTAGNL
ncbi:hypothetical protein TD95_000889 [Thielaviopsis punctulata]|uniref:DNA replication licensing factor MCM4 n=1 Tax=Thielaviopsis punctulata TaxID=72032 RepID=A0A0F4Z870_9PEZI|nr:hypothetical protein TD95_000889 [Thielaviopsis punctulata]